MRLSNLTKNSDNFFSRLKELYNEMSDTYNRLVNLYGLDCKGCKDNCCQTRFHNHTYVEYFYLMEGIAALPEDRNKELMDRAFGVCNQIDEADARGETPRIMCPLNEKGLCVLYEYRPMVCRLHGVPYDMALPGRPSTRGDGCSIFQDDFQDKAYIAFDRTPLYRSLSLLERDLRMETGRSDRVNLTVAQMMTFDLQ